MAYSNQKNISFIFCPYPMTIDKSSDWGKGNIQNFPSGAFLKQNKKGIITHGVQPNKERIAPIGWEKQTNGLFRKTPIWILEELEVGREIDLNTLDGQINYKIKEVSYLVAQNKNNSPDLQDTWIVSLRDFKNDYSFDE